MSRAIAVAVALLLSACSSNQNTGTATEGSPSGTGVGATTGNGTGPGTGTGAATGNDTGTTGGSTAGGGQSSASGTGSTTGVPAGPALSAFQKQYSNDLCNFDFGCQQQANYYYTLCTSYSAPGFGAIPAAVDAGRIQYHPDKAQQCLDTFPNAPCFGASPDQTAACQDVFTGLVVPGSPCNSTADCSGGYCTGDGGCGGVCVQWAESGDSCTDSNPCNPTEYLTCVHGTCATFQQDEQQCGLPDHPNCGPGFDCMGGVCFPVPAELTRQCEFGHGDCDAHAYCFQAPGAARGACAAAVQINGACGEDAAHLPNAFSSTDAECDDGFQNVQCFGAGTLLDGGISPGTCQSTKGETDPCTDPLPQIDLTKPYNSGCLKGLDCLGSQCLRPHGVGIACYPIPFQCDPTKAYCDPDLDGGTCVALILPGKACTNSDQCGAFNICNAEGVCGLPSGDLCSPAF